MTGHNPIRWPPPVEKIAHQDPMIARGLRPSSNLYQTATVNRFREDGRREGSFDENRRRASQ